MLLLEEKETDSNTSEKISQLVLLKSSYVEEARLRQEDKLEELEEILAEYNSCRASIEATLAEKLANANSSSSIGGSIGDAGGAIELTQST